MKFLEFMDKFGNEENAIDYFRQVYYPYKMICPNCYAQDRIYKRAKSKGKLWLCSKCNREFSIFKGTIFEKSSTDFRIWLYAIYQMLMSKKGYPALQLQRETDVTYKTAWRIMNAIRVAMGNTDKSALKQLFQGIIEIDETYVGGKPRKGTGATRKFGRGTNKTPVVGVIDRERGKVSSTVAIPNEKGQKLTGKQLLEIIEKRVKEQSIIITDDFKGYNILDKQRADKYWHLKVNHSEGQYSAGDGVHTNTVESYWAILKRGITGIYHHVSVKHLPLYLNEFDFRYNNRDNKNVFYTLLEQCIVNRRWTPIRYVTDGRPPGNNQLIYLMYNPPKPKEKED